MGIWWFGDRVCRGQDIAESEFGGIICMYLQEFNNNFNGFLFQTELGSELVSDWVRKYACDDVDDVYKIELWVEAVKE